MEGFTSTGLVAEHISSFYGNTWIEIQVNPDNLGGEIDCGFANVTDISSQPHEREVIFNPINIFKVVKCERKKRVKLPSQKWIDAYQFIVLEYAPLKDMVKRHRKGEYVPDIEKQVVMNY